ncbi:MAG: glycosyltransferase [Clostridia bacterium]|nr:glycosyltransferase [Clostridia bacterium]
MDKKLSIIIPNYNNEKYLKRSLECVIEQTYKNLEIIVVNDGSKGNSDEIMKEYQEKDNRIKYVKHDVNKGLFQARLTGASVATGDYIAFLDADDYTSIDFYRTLMNNAIENNSDIVIGNTVLEYDSGKKIEYNLFNMNFKELKGSQCIDEYFRQEGLNFSWHTIWNKIYSMKIWKEATRHYKKINKRLIMTEDFAFSTVLFYYANKITRTQNDNIFYCQHEVTSTSIKDINYNKVKNNISDLMTSFSFIEDFLKEVKIYDKYEQQFLKWKHLYSMQHRSYIKQARKVKATEKKELNELMDTFCSEKKQIENANLFSSVETNWNDKLEKVKKAIIDKEVKYVSFDIFDTLVVRPFLEPVDLFRLLDRDYRKISNNKAGISFSKIRTVSESIARDEQFKRNPEVQEVTLDAIYETIHGLYEIDNNILNILKEKEKEYELRFCKRRNTTYELYQLAIDIGKKVICTSDMYLPEETIVKMLKGNGYTQIEKLYLSSTIKKTKWTGDLHRYVLKDLNIKPNEIIHLGDNRETDYKRVKDLGMKAVYIPKTAEVMQDTVKTNDLSQMLVKSLPFWQDNKESQRFLGIRTMMAMVANKYFDNPFRTFNEKSDFNADPYLIGYYALGMYAFGVTKWLIDNIQGNYDKISFMARDGYLVMQTYKIMKELYKDMPTEEYMYVSRKALIPIMIVSKLDFYKLSEILEIEKHTPKGVLKYISRIIKVDENKLEQLCKSEKIEFTKRFKTIQEFNKYIKIVVDNFYNEEEHKKSREKLKSYFNTILGEKPAVFDVGYSGRPEFYLTELCNKSVDTYFLNINRDDAIEYAEMGKFNLKTFFPAKPTATGNAYELLFSKLAPSCIAYDVNGEKVSPVFEEYESIYQVEYIVKTIQEAAIEFVKDVVETFKEDIDILYYQDYYITLPIMAYFNSSRRIDKQPLSAIEFEDDIRTGKVRKMIDDMQEDLNSKSQCSLEKLFEKGNINLETNKVGDLSYNPIVDLNERNRFVRLIYYILFDRTTIKRRIKEIFKI